MLIVTGGAGFIGSNFVLYWMRKYPDEPITVIDNLSHGSNAAYIPDSVQFIKMDICQLRELPAKAKQIVHFAGVREFPKIVHFAAESHVDRSIAASAPFIQSNVVGTHAILELALRYNCRFHHVSTDEVFGSLGPHDAPFTEQTRYDPKSPYAATKAASDHLVRAYAHTYGLPATITNCSNNYGPRQSVEKLIPLMISNALAGKPLPVYGDGSNIRDWIFVDDHCRAIDLVLKHGVLGESYNVGGRNEITNLELVKMLCERLGASKRLIKFVKDRLGHDYRYAVDDTKIRKLGYLPQMPFSKGLDSTIKWYLDAYRPSA